MVATLAEVAPEGILLAGGGRAILLQLAYPAIGRGVARHSDFDSRPLDRLHGTLAYVYALANGTEADIAAVRQAVNRAHVPVRGDGYSAMDARLQLWVAATLYDSGTRVYELVFGALDDASADRVYREYARLGTELQMPADLWPRDRAAFATYFEATLGTLAVDEEVHDVARKLLGRRPLVRFISVGLLPPRVRELFGYSWNDRDERRFARLVHRSAAIYRVLPRWIRHAPQRLYLRRVRRRDAGLRRLRRR